MTDEMTFTLLKPLAQNSIVNNLTGSLGGIPNSTTSAAVVGFDLGSPHNQSTIEVDISSTAMGSRPSSSKYRP